MTITGIVAEYNPLHKGHLYHIAETRRITGCNSIVTVMSGNFVQRGEPALVDKWIRTKMALEQGTDLVIELPLVYSISSAEGFAYGSVSILNSLGIVEYISFGSECADLKSLSFLAQILSEEPEDYKVELKTCLKKGLSFPKSRQIALTNYIINKFHQNVNSYIELNLLEKSNNILGIEYIKALIRLNSTIKPVTVKRLGNEYNSAALSDSYSSATSIRKNIHNPALIYNSMSETSFRLLNEAFDSGLGPIDFSSYTDMIFYALRRSSLESLKNIAEVTEGFEYKLKRASEDCSNLNELISMLKSKRYAETRIQRILLYTLLGITKEIAERKKNKPEYIRILGFTERGRQLLKEIKKHADIPIITNPSPKDKHLLEMDINATDIYCLALKKDQYRTARQDLMRSPVYVK